MKIDLGSVAKGIQETVSNAASEVQKTTSEAGAGMAGQIQQGTEHLKQAGKRVAEDKKGSINLNAGVLARELNVQVGKSVSIPSGEVGAKGKFQAGVDGHSLGEKLGVEGEAALREGITETAGPLTTKLEYFLGVRGEAHEQVQLNHPGFEQSAEAFAGAKVIFGQEVKDSAGSVDGQVEGWTGVGVADSVHITTEDDKLSAGGRVGAGFGIGGAVEGNVTVKTKIDEDK